MTPTSLGSAYTHARRAWIALFGRGAVGGEYYASLRYAGYTALEAWKAAS